MISGPRWEGVLIDRVKVSNLVGHPGCHGKCEGCATDEVAILRTILSVRTVRYSTHNTDVVGGVIGDVSGGGGGGGVGLGEWRLYSKLFPALLLSPSSSPRHHHRDCHHRRVASHAAILHLLYYMKHNALDTRVASPAEVTLCSVRADRALRSWGLTWIC
jgi:hypothetical protein